MARIVITGGAGFIGSYLVDHHLAKGDEVWAVDNLFTGKLPNLEQCQKNPLFRFSQKDLTSDDLTDVLSWGEKCYHMAAVAGYKTVLKYPIKTLSDNIRSCENVLKTAANCNPKIKILISSSSEVYGTAYSIPLSEDLPLHFSQEGKTQKNYALSKFVNEMTAFSYIEEKGLYIVIARIFNTTGPRQSYTNNFYVLPHFVEQALSNKPLTIYGDGTQTRSFCSVHDTVAMLDLYLSKASVNGQILNIGNDEETSIKDLASLICKKANSKSTLTYTPYEKVFGRPFFDTLKRRPNLAKMRQVLGYTHSFSTEKIVEQTVAHFKEHGKYNAESSLKN